MPDQLRERFDAFRSAVEHSGTAGLHDVRVRRIRRTRTRVAVATAASVTALAFTGVVVLPQLGPDTTTIASEGADVLSDSDSSRGSDPTEAHDQVAEQVPTEEATSEQQSTEEPPPEQAPTEDPTPQGPFSITPDSLLTWEDIQAVGETGPGTAPYPATLVFPPLCGPESSEQQYSEPSVVYSAVWTISDGTLTQSDLEYGSDQQASDALARLVQDSQACPIFNEFGSIQSTGSDTSVGAEIEFFELRVESGEDGSIHFSTLAVARVANVLVEVVLRPDGESVLDAQSRIQRLAQAAVSKIEAGG